jgi:hypothetical protein
MKIECKNCGHWLVEVHCQDRPTPHLKCVCRKCGAVWLEKEDNLFEDEGEDLVAKAVVIPLFGPEPVRAPRPFQVEPPLVLRSRLHVV